MLKLKIYLNKIFSESRLFRESGAGFTLIELLIVIAIIGILASIVFVNSGNSRNQANDTAIKADLDSMRLSAEQLYETNANGYETVCKEEEPKTESRLAFEKAREIGYNKQGFCKSLKYKWAACVYLNVDIGQAWCVDNAGNNKNISTEVCDSLPGASSAVCP